MQPSKSKPAVAILKSEWDGIAVEYGCLEDVGEFDFIMPKNALSVAFAPHNRVTWSVDGGIRQTSNLAAGSVFLYAEREFTWHQREQASEYVNLTLEPQLLERLANESGLSTAKFDHRVMFVDPTILHVAQLLKGEVINSGLAGNLYVESLRNLLAVHLLRNYTETSATGTSTKTTQSQSVIGALKLKQIQDYIEENLTEELAISDLAALIPMSQFHFARAFKAAVGESPHRYVTQRRMERAKILLSVTQLSVAEISYRVGFSNQSHFTAQFRKATGATPKQYREST
ncbi:MAG: AraC family transcriptional regulator [Scytonematopsis contorta HA4267-MV1]|jgi:AraC family transcriptional regulator|nr:AraC family transcriptional regulator [Scytonematopsis contorta HA4267-MV1]